MRRVLVLTLVGVFGADGLTANVSQVERTYSGRDLDASWRQEADARIEQIRKASLTVRVVNSVGLPVGDAIVDIEMTRHVFGFGSAVSAKWLTDPTEDGRRYRAIVASNFNKVVFENDLKRRQWEIGRSNLDVGYRRDWVDQALNWLAAHEMRVRGHRVVNGPVTSVDATQLDKDSLRNAIWDHATNKVSALGDRVHEWDVLNHPVASDATLRTLLGESVDVELMNLVRRLAPHAEVWVNEGHVIAGSIRRRSYAEFIESLIGQGASPDGIGFMGHFREGLLTPPTTILAVLNRYADLVPALQLTELDVDVGGDTVLQADYLRDVMTVAFSHPAVTAVVLWGFWEGRHWRPSAALYRTDWSEKPAARVWYDLVYGRWWTRNSGHTNVAGEYNTRGFLGEYEITVQYRQHRTTMRVHLTKGGRRVTFVMP